MKTPFHRFFAPFDSESRIEGGPVAAGAVTPNSAPPTEAGEQTEMMTRARRRNEHRALGNRPALRGDRN